MAKKLTRDMAGIEDPLNAESALIPLSKSEDQRHKDYVTGALRYACCYWASHLALAQETKELWVDLEQFGQKNILYWIEALSLVGKLNTAEQSLQYASHWFQVYHFISYSPLLLTYLTILLLEVNKHSTLYPKTIC